MEVIGDFNIRGGIKSVITARVGARTEERSSTVGGRLVAPLVSLTLATLVACSSATRLALAAGVGPTLVGRASDDPGPR